MRYRQTCLNNRSYLIKCTCMCSQCNLCTILLKMWSQGLQNGDLRLGSKERRWSSHTRNEVRSVSHGNGVRWTLKSVNFSLIGNGVDERELEPVVSLYGVNHKTVIRFIFQIIPSQSTDFNCQVTTVFSRDHWPSQSWDTRARIGRWIVGNFQIFIISAVKICKQYLQTVSASGDPYTGVSALDLTGGFRPHTAWFITPNENLWHGHALHEARTLVVINISRVWIRKNYENRLIFDGVIRKTKRVMFNCSQCTTNSNCYQTPLAWGLPLMRLRRQSPGYSMQ